MIYQILLDSILPESISQWFAPLEVDFLEGQTQLTGDLEDQAALFGILATIRNLNIKLISIQPKEEES